MALVIAITGVVTVRILGLRTLSVHAEPMPLSPEGFDYQWWNDALGRWVHDGGVDYDSVVSEQGDLRRFVATLSVAGGGSPTTPEIRTRSGATSASSIVSKRAVTSGPR